MKEDLIFIDTETGGLDPDVHSLLQIGYVIENPNWQTHRNEMVISKHNYTTTEQAMKINNLDLDFIREVGNTEDYAVREIINHIARTCTTKPVVIGHNVNFDIGFMKAIFKRTGYDYESTFNHRVVDTMSILRALNHAGIIPDTACNSAGAFKFFGIDNENAHTALADAKATRELYWRLISILGDLEVHHGV